jgi:hypothetical protein
VISRPQLSRTSQGLPAVDVEYQLLARVTTGPVRNCRSALRSVQPSDTCRTGLFGSLNGHVDMRGFELLGAATSIQSGPWTVLSKWLH